MNLQYDRTLIISTGESRKTSIWTEQKITVADLWERLKTPRRGSETMAEYLSMPKAQQDNLKDVGGFVGGSLEGGRRNKNSVTGRDVITLDFDSIPEKATEAVLLTLRMMGVSWCVYSTRKHRPGAPRLRILFPLSRTVSAGEYGPIARWAAAQIGVEMADPSTFEAERLMYWPSCCADGEYIFRYEDAPLLNPDEALEKVSAEPGTGKAQNTPYKAPETIPEGRRTKELVKAAGLLIGRGLNPESAKAALRSENDLKCNPPLTEQELEQQVFPALYREKWHRETRPYTNDLTVSTSLLETLCALDVANNKQFGLNDAGSSRLFIAACGDRVQYAQDRRKWLFYTGQRWDIDGENAVKEQLKQLADALMVYTLQNVTDENKRTELFKFYGKWQQLRVREIILRDAQSIHPVRSEIFDKDTMLFNCQNGTLDLKTFSFRDHQPRDYIARMAAVAYDPDAKSPRWLQFIDEITGGDAALARFIQKACGYGLTGSTRFECLFICYGATSRNGKSTLLETMAFMLGDYSATANPETFTKNKLKAGNQHSEDIARLHGARFVVVPELPRGMEFDSAHVKQLTGRDTITARRLNEGSFQFTPQFKLFINTNHQPRVDDMTVFESERIKMIPFNARFVGDRRDPYLKDTLQEPENLSGILNWCIDGLRALHAEGFQEPPAVFQATRDFRMKQDKLLRFFEDKCELAPAFEVPLMELHTAFAEWCGESGIMSVSVPRFKEMLVERQLHTKKKRAAGSGKSGKTLLYVLGVKLAQKNQ